MHYLLSVLFLLLLCVKIKFLGWFWHVGQEVMCVVSPGLCFICHQKTMHTDNKGL